MSKTRFPYKDREIVLVTKHKKEAVIKPLLEKETGCQIIVESEFDTDRLGTFSREIKRKKSQEGIALKKIQYGMKIKKTDIGIASEGCFGFHPYLSIPWNIELVVLFDKRNELVVNGVYESADTNYNHILTDRYDDALVFAKNIGFPEHHVIMRPDNNKSKKIIKGINHYDSLLDAFNLAKLKSRTGRVFIETDMRAYANPTRMNNIKLAVQNLVQNIHMICPRCGSPGFVATEKVKGLPCQCCGTPSELTLKNIHRCQKCNHIYVDMYPSGNHASPEYCHYCNP
jgi:transcription elongation factor Elf1